MANLKMTVEEIVDCIELKEQSWFNTMGTNCYAYALGLDLDEDMITKYAYQVGVIGAILNDIDIKEVLKLPYDERLALDLNSIKIPFEECDPLDVIEYNQWKIAMFANPEKENSFHFMRECSKGIWWQKWGSLFGYPVCKDFDSQIITDPRTCNIGDYEYLKTYALTRKGI